MSGMYNDKTTGTPLCAFIQNTDTRSQDYSNISKLARPGHADYTGAVRYKGFNDVRGGGHFSGRLTAPLVFAGAVCAQILERRGIYTGAHIAEIHNIKDKEFDRTNVSKDDILDIRYKKFPVIDDAQGEKMFDDIQKPVKAVNRWEASLNVRVLTFQQELVLPIFDGLENTLAQLIFGIPAVKGLEFGAGFLTAKWWEVKIMMISILMKEVMLRQKQTITEESLAVFHQVCLLL